MPELTLNIAESALFFFVNLNILQGISLQSLKLKEIINFATNFPIKAISD